MDIALSFHKGSEGRDTVPDEVVGLAKDVQINLRHFWLQADNLELSLEELLYFRCVGL